MSQMKLALTRDPRAASIISPAKGLEAKKLKSPSSAGKSVKGAKASKSRPLVGSCHQTLLKYVSSADSKQKVLKTLSENSVQIEQKLKNCTNSSGSSIQNIEAKPKVVTLLSENSLVMEEKQKDVKNPQLELKAKVIKSRLEQCVSSDGEATFLTVDSSKLKPAQPINSSLQYKSSGEPVSLSSTTLQVSNNAASLPPIMSSHPVKSLQQPSTFKAIPPAKQADVCHHPTSPQDKPGAPPLISCSLPVSKVGKASTLKSSLPMAGKHLQENNIFSGHSSLGLSREKSQLQSVKGSSGTVPTGMHPILTSVEASTPCATPPNPKKARRPSTAQLPVSRVRTIMKTNFQSSKNGPQLGQESVPIVCKAAVSVLCNKA